MTDPIVTIPPLVAEPEENRFDLIRRTAAKDHTRLDVYGLLRRRKASAPPDSLP